MTGRVVDVEGGVAPVVATDRFCPVCGAAAVASFCAADGTATVRRVPSDARLPELQPGAVVQGRYRVQRRIGRGGFGAVYSATHTGTGQEVALKLLSVDTGADNLEHVRRFWQEAQITARLRHENTVRVFDVGQSDEGAFYLAMEHLRGQTLQARLEALAAAGQTMKEAEAVAVGVAICRSLHEAHGKGLVHRDLKPGNVMLLDGEGDDSEHSVKVLDFGIARSAGSSLTGSGTILGTPAYMSPEQCRGTDIDGRSDLYALGALLYRCVAGRPPFVDPNPLTVMFQHAASPPADPREYAATPLSAALVAVLMRVLAKEPEQRFADARALREALESVAGGGAPAIPDLVPGSLAKAAQSPEAGGQQAPRMDAPSAAVGSGPLRTATPLADGSGTPRLWPWLLALTTGLLATAAYFAQRGPEPASAPTAAGAAAAGETQASADPTIDPAAESAPASPDAAATPPVAALAAPVPVVIDAGPASAAVAPAGPGDDRRSDDAMVAPADDAGAPPTSDAGGPLSRPASKAKSTTEAKRTSADRSATSTSGRRSKTSAGGRDTRPVTEPTAVPTPGPQVAPPAAPKPAPVVRPERPVALD